MSSTSRFFIAATLWMALSFVFSVLTGTPLQMHGILSLTVITVGGFVWVLNFLEKIEKNQQKLMKYFNIAKEEKQPETPEEEG
ncbi:MAG: hypothetical protein PHD51_03650 [Patescibacteria group bacterium]|nr:hypothetical protein [Patescibacteria group bacterium]MDD5490932.1 hypothetical protein [Patescibacteria group bacterium]